MIHCLAYIHRLSLITLSWLVLTAVPLLAEADKTQRRLSLSGIGNVTASPDIARITSGVVSQGDTAASALAANSSSMTKIIAGIKSAGIKTADIQTTGFSVNPRYVYDQRNRQKPPEIVGYQVQNKVHITVRKLEDLGRILDKVITLGANQVNGISFSLDNPQKLQDEARKRAVEDAYRKAQLYAKATNNQLGPIIALSEGQLQRPGPQFAQGAVALRAEAAAVPIEAGEQSVSLQVNITWQLN